MIGDKAKLVLTVYVPYFSQTGAWQKGIRELESCKESW